MCPYLERCPSNRVLSFSASDGVDEYYAYVEPLSKDTLEMRAPP